MDSPRPHFPDPLQLCAIAGTDTYVLLSDFRYRRICGLIVRVPADFFTNGASIPRFWWRLIGPPMSGRYREAAVVHDFLWEEARKGRVSYGFANAVFREAMEMLGVAWWRRWVMWAAVSINGWWQGRRRSK